MSESFQDLEPSTVDEVPKQPIHWGRVVFAGVIALIVAGSIGAYWSYSKEKTAIIESEKRVRVNVNVEKIRILTYINSTPSLRDEEKRMVVDWLAEGKIDTLGFSDLEKAKILGALGEYAVYLSPPGSSVNGQ